MWFLPRNNLTEVPQLLDITVDFFHGEPELQNRLKRRDPSPIPQMSTHRSPTPQRLPTPESIPERSQSPDDSPSPHPTPSATPSQHPSPQPSISPPRSPSPSPAPSSQLPRMVTQQHSTCTNNYLLISLPGHLLPAPSCPCQHQPVLQPRVFPATQEDVQV